MATKFNFTIDQGSDVKIELTFKDSLLAPINLTGYTFSAQGKAKFSDTSPSFTFSFTNVNLAIGRIDMILPKAQTIPLELKCEGKFFYDVEGTIGGLTTRYFEGVVTVSPEVTK